MTDFDVQSARNSPGQCIYGQVAQVDGVYQYCVGPKWEKEGGFMYGSLAYLEDGAGMGRVRDSSRQNDEVAGCMQVAGFGDRSRLGGKSESRGSSGQAPAPGD